MTDHPPQVMTIERFEEMKRNANQATWFTAADSRKPVTLGFKMDEVNPVEANGCRKCGNILPAGAYCKGIDCPLNPNQKSRIKAQEGTK